MTKRAIALLAPLLLVIPTSPAIAGTYTVHSCTTPSGRWVGAAGWQASSAHIEQERESGVVSDCGSQGDALEIRFGTDRLPVSPGIGRTWSFTAPVGTIITGVDLERWFQLGWPVVPESFDRPYVFDVWHDSDDFEDRVEFRYPSWGENISSDGLPRVISVREKNWSALSFRLRCWELMGESLCGPLDARVVVPRASLLLKDLHDPRASTQLEQTAQPLRGVASLSLDASDVGAGVYRWIVAVDGSEMGRGVLDANGGACGDVEPGNEDAYEFAVPQPCPLEASGVVGLDTRSLRDGAHTVEVSVEDAAGNRSTVERAAIVTHNAPVVATPPHVHGDPRVGAELSATDGWWDGAPSAYEHRWLRCDASGAACTPIAGANGSRYVVTPGDAYHRLAVEVVAANDSGAGSARSAPTAAVADADGRTSPGGGTGAAGAGGQATLPTPVPEAADGADRRADGDGQPSVPLRLTAALRLPGGRTAARVRTTRARRWTAVGRLTDGRGVAVAQAQLALQVRDDGRGWATRGTVRTDRDGRFARALPAGPSREVRFRYLTPGGGATVTSPLLRLDVLASVSIGVDRRRVTGRRIVVIRGRVGRERLPRGGVLVTLQGYQHGWGWRTFRTVRASRTGAWRTRYRFRSTAGRFGFRAVVPHQGGYPFATTTSAPVYVTVG